MLIKEISLSTNLHYFQRVILIYRDTDNEMFDDNFIDEIGKWIEKNFSDNYVLLEMYSTVIGGGYADIENSYSRYKEQYKDRRISRKNKILSHYELRCSDHDAIMFKLRWV